MLSSWPIRLLENSLAERTLGGDTSSSSVAGSQPYAKIMNIQAVIFAGRLAVSGVERPLRSAFDCKLFPA